MAHFLTTSSTMQCPHGGSVSATSSNTTVKADGSAVLRSSDTFTIAGCGLTFPPPHPCMQVQWVQPAAKSKVSGDFTLTESSVGMCVAADQATQGTVTIVNAQAKGGGL
jgi:hypothetical protein